MDLEKIEQHLKNSGFIESSFFHLEQYDRGSLRVNVSRQNQSIESYIQSHDGLSLKTGVYHSSFDPMREDSFLEETMNRFIRFSKCLHDGVRRGVFLKAFTPHDSWLYDMIGNQFELELSKDGDEEILYCEKRVSYDRVELNPTENALREFDLKAEYALRGAIPISSTYRICDHLYPDGSFATIQQDFPPKCHSFLKELEKMLKYIDKEIQTLLKNTDFTLRCD